MTKSSGRWFAGRVLGKKAARITVLLVALAFVGIFWVLNETGVIEPGAGVAVVGVALFVLVAGPLGMLVGSAADKKVNPEQ